jgi:hypothetical protein
MPDTNKPIAARPAPPIAEVQRMLSRFRRTETPPRRRSPTRVAGPPVLKTRTRTD